MNVNHQSYRLLVALDPFGNSVRAQEAIRYIAEQLDLSIFGSAK